MRIILFSLLIQLAALSTAQTSRIPSTITSGIPYDTIYLKNETKLIFMTDNENRSIRMVNAAIDTTIHSLSLKYSESSIGWLKADYENYFILYYRQKEPILRIYDKQNGKTIGEGDVMAFDTIQNIICYADRNRPNVIALFDFANSKLEKYISPTVPCLHWWFCVQITRITEKELTILWTGQNNVKKEKKYVR